MMKKVKERRKPKKVGDLEKVGDITRGPQVLCGGTVDVLVGTDKQLFAIHETLARKASAFFDKALSGLWKEANRRTIELPDDDPRIFGLFVSWLYFLTIPTNIDDDDEKKSLKWIELAKVYVLGDRLLCPHFKNAAVDAIVEKSSLEASQDGDPCPDGVAIWYIYRHSIKDALIRKLMVDLCVCFGTPELLDWNDKSFIPHSFVVDLAGALLAGDLFRRSKPIFTLRYYT
ncbi:hypothetical protein BDV12DRAFT_198556 [Aspergillus spectabilis]